MKSGEAFPSQRLKADDLQGRRIAVTIETVEMEEVGQGDKKETKPCAHFRGKDKSLVLNRTNWNRLADFLKSDDSDDWSGRSVVLGVEKVDFQGKRVPAIRVLGLARANTQTQSQVAPPPEIEPDEPQEEFRAGDDDVPF